MSHEPSHIQNVCRYCGLYRDYWRSLAACPGREAFEKTMAAAYAKVNGGPPALRSQPKFSVETLGGDTKWKVVASHSNRMDAIAAARSLATENQQTYFVRIATVTGSRTLFKARSPEDQ